MPTESGQIRHFSRFEDFQTFLLVRARALSMAVRECTLPELAPQWLVGEEISRPDGRFFRVTGLEVIRAAGREVTGWVQPIIAGETDGRLALFLKGSHDLALVRVKAEAGNVGVKVDGGNTRVLVSPTLQFSRGNLEHTERARRGELDALGKPMKPVPLCDLLDLVMDDLWKPGSGDGGRFLDKRNWYAVVPLRDGEARKHVEPAVQALGKDAADFAWVSQPVLRQIVHEGLGNEFLERLYARI